MSKKKLLIVYTLNQTFHWFIIGLIIPVTALFQLEKGLDLFQIGVTGAVWAGTIILLELPTGGLSDTIGRKKVYLISLIVMFLGTTMLLFSWDFITVVLGISLFAAARALSSGSMDAWFVDEFNRIDPEANLQAALAKAGIFIPIGIGAGSLLGGFLPMILGGLTAQIPGFDIYSINLIAVCVSVIVQFILTSILVMEHLHPDRSKGILLGFRRFPVVLSTSLKFGVKNRIILLLLFSSLGYAVGIAGLEQFWQPQLKIILGSDSQTWIFGVLAAGYFLASSAGSIIITPVCKLFKNNYTLKSRHIITMVVLAG